MSAARLFGPEDLLPAPGSELVETVLDRAVALSMDDLRFLAESALPAFALRGDPQRAAAVRVLTELRKRVALVNLGGKALSSVEYLMDGGRNAEGAPEGGLYRIFDAVPPLFEMLQKPPAGTRYGRLTLATRDDLTAPGNAARDVLVIDFAGFESESFQLDSASRAAGRST